MVCYSFGFTPLQGLYPAEVLAYENRAKGIALQTWVGTAFGLINTFGMPVALPALKWKSEIIPTNRVRWKLTISVLDLYVCRHTRRHTNLLFCGRDQTTQSRGSGPRV
jgi:hypothetical protein